MESSGSQLSSDPQFGIVRVLRPYAGYEAVYEGVSAATPIMLTEGGVALDPLAGQPGYDPRLLRGIPTPIGSRVHLWLPITGYIESTDPTVVARYRYEILWRFRNTFDYRQTKAPYHYPKQGQGAPDTTSGVALPRVVIPGGNNTVTYIQAEPGTDFGRASANVRSEDLVIGSSNNPLPLIPGGGVGIVEQGIADPATFPGALAPLYQVYELRAMGDEMLLGVLRDTTPTNWSFTPGVFPAGSDALLSTLFATGQDVGVYVTVGMAP